MLSPYVLSSEDDEFERLLLLLYLNNDTFLNNQDDLADVIKAAKEDGLTVILVHEQDLDKSSCWFLLNIESTSEELIKHPFNIISTFQERRILQAQSPPYSAKDGSFECEGTFSPNRK